MSKASGGKTYSRVPRVVERLRGIPIIGAISPTIIDGNKFVANLYKKIKRKK